MTTTSGWKHSLTDKAPHGAQVLVHRVFSHGPALSLVGAGAPTLLGQMFEFTDGCQAWEEELSCWWFLPPPVPTNAP